MEQGVWAGVGGRGRGLSQDVYQGLQQVSGLDSSLDQVPELQLPNNPTDRPNTRGREGPELHQTRGEKDQKREWDHSYRPQTRRGEGPEGTEGAELRCFCVSVRCP
ncbi:unnamed protein product [Knipowitschia caucasica]|uniref:Uncharacterized protein n=1 Tax=Knipowitschia caucasica TaxID=637954 RepID=A0AAV2J8K7_KNICA